MRIYKTLAILALTLVPVAASAQTNSELKGKGFIDFGVRGTSTTGEPSRYERFRDLQDGFFLENFRYETTINGWRVNLGADKVAGTDQKYFGTFVRPGTLKAYAMWDQIPFLMSTTTRTPYTEVSPGVFRLDDALQTALQNQTNTTLRYAAMQAAVAASSPFELKSWRHAVGGGFEWFLGASKNASFKVNVKRTDREGALPFGAYQSTEIELPVPINQHFTDFDASVEAAKGNALFRVGYTGSWFVNDAGTTVWDNPTRLLDNTDASRTSSQGRHAPLSPDSTRLGVNAMVSYKLAKKTRVTAYAMMATLTDAGQSIVPFTINTAVTLPTLYRPTVEGKAVTTAANVTLTSRPNETFNFIAKYRYFDYDNQTPEFIVSQRVGNDGGTVSNLTTPFITEPYALKRHLAEADLYITPKGFLTASVGGTRMTEDRNDRIFSTITENTGRAKVDLINANNGMLTVRSVWEYSQRRGEGFDPLILSSISEKIWVRHFDIADRDRTRLALVGAFMPVNNWGVNFSASRGKDDYKPTGLDNSLGMRDNDNKVYSAGVTGTPRENINLGVSYSYETYHALQMNNTASSTTIADLTRNFSTTGDDKVHSWIANADILSIGGKLDVHATYDFNKSRINYIYGVGDPVPTTLTAPVQLPEITSDLTRGTIDGVFHINKTIAFGLTYWYDKYSLNDYTLDSQAREARVPGNYMLLGYAFEPYTAHTTWGRLIVRW